MTVSTPIQPDYTTQDGSTYKANIDGAIDVAKRMGWAFAPHAQSTPDMTVRLETGHIWNGASRVDVAAQSTGTISAPTTNPRNDLVVIDRATGGVSVITGTEGASPSDPALTTDKMPVARVKLTVGMTEITNADLDDVRVLFIPAGTAALIDTGIGEGQVPVLLAGGQMPAVGGANLTGFKGLQALTLQPGDVLYASAGGTLARLAKGNDDQVLKLVAGLPTWSAAGGGLSNFASGTFSNNMTDPPGVQAITGVGFAPDLVFFTWQHADTFFGHGIDAGVGRYGYMHYGGVIQNHSTSNSIVLWYVNASRKYEGKISSMDADGFTITWTKTGSPSNLPFTVGWCAIKF